MGWCGICVDDVDTGSEGQYLYAKKDVNREGNVGRKERMNGREGKQGETDERCIFHIFSMLYCFFSPINYL